MADEKRTDITINGNIAEWDLYLDGDVEGTYKGKFKFKCYLLPSESLASGRDYRALLGANPALASDNDSFTAYALSQLKYRIISAPPFWATNKNSGIDGDIPDTNILSAVLEAAIAAELQYKGELADRKAKALQQAIKAAEKLTKKEDEVASEDKDSTGDGQS